MDTENTKILKQIVEAFKEVSEDDDALLKLLEALAGGKATYKTAREYSRKIGNLSTAVLKKFIETMGPIPDGYDALRKAIEETAYEPVADFANQVQRHINEQAKLGLRAIRAPFDVDKASGIAHNVVHAVTLEEAERALDAVKTFAESVVNDTIETNALIQSNAGLHPKVERSGGWKCCEWCAALEGTFEYGYQPADFFRQHENCKCDIEFSGKNIRYRINGTWNAGRGTSQKGLGT